MISMHDEGVQLPVYTFYMHDGKKAVPSFEFSEFETPDLALAHAKRLLQERRRYTFVEVFQDDHSLAKVDRTEA